ncbi:MAG: SDR family oxidoreductase [Spirochaetales bacterium]|nr:SDR family oxidoreductase [Spirochaetales bacterium]
MVQIDLSGKVVLVLGGSRGIGEGIVRVLCSAGAVVVFTHTGKRENRTRIAALLDEIAQQGGRAEEAAVDAADPAGTAELAALVADRHGKIDGLVCNAGRNLARPVEQIDPEVWAENIELNLGSAFYGIQAVLPHMIKARFGRIVLVGSTAVFDGGSGAIDYVAAKAGMSGLMAYICRNYARGGITANIIHPSAIETELLMVRYADPDKKSRLLAEIPAGRLGKPEDIAGLAAFLLSSWGDYICGQQLVADGGRTLFNR